MTATLVVLVSGRGALAPLAGVPSVERHVLAGRRLGMEVVVVYPKGREALGAEVRGIVAGEARCVSSQDFAADRKGGGLALVVAAEWYLSLSALVALRDQPGERALAQVCERGTVSVPLARLPVAEVRQIVRRLGEGTAAAALAALRDGATTTIDIDPRDEQRLSDNVSTAHAEDKLVETLFGPEGGVHVLRIRRALAPEIARHLAGTPLGPAALSALKLAMGLLAAWIIEGGSYGDGLAGALLYFSARLLGSAGTILARANFADGEIREKLDLAGDTVLHVALLWALAGGPARGEGAAILAAIATVGVVVSTAVAYVFVIREAWESRARSGFQGRAGDEFVSRFVQRDGIAYALVFSAATGTLHLLLWAAAIASHLFYVLWLVARQRRSSGPMLVGRAV